MKKLFRVKTKDKRIITLKDASFDDIFWGIYANEYDLPFDKTVEYIEKKYGDKIWETPTSDGDTSVLSNAERNDIINFAKNEAKNWNQLDIMNSHARYTPVDKINEKLLRIFGIKNTKIHDNKNESENIRYYKLKRKDSYSLKDDDVLAKYKESDNVYKIIKTSSGKYYYENTSIKGSGLVGPYATLEEAKSYLIKHRPNAKQIKSVVDADTDMRWGGKTLPKADYEVKGKPYYRLELPGNMVASYYEHSHSGQVVTRNPYDETDYHWGYSTDGRSWKIYRSGRNVGSFSGDIDAVISELKRLDKKEGLGRTGGIW